MNGQTNLPTNEIESVPKTKKKQVSRQVLTVQRFFSQLALKVSEDIKKGDKLGVTIETLQNIKTI